MKSSGRRSAFRFTIWLKTFVATPQRGKAATKAGQVERRKCQRNDGQGNELQTLLPIPLTNIPLTIFAEMLDANVWSKSEQKETKGVEIGDFTNACDPPGAKANQPGKLLTACFKSSNGCVASFKKCPPRLTGNKETFSSGLHYNKVARRLANRKPETKCICKSLRLNTVICYQ
jgi:hypothetical protein